MKKIIFFLPIIITINLFCMESDGEYRDSLPIYYFPGKHSSQAHLNIVIPKRFKEISKEFADFKEYIFNKTPNPDNWSECINTHSAFNSNAQDELIKLRSLILANSSNPKVKYISIENMITHNIATIIISYTRNNRHEIIFARYISGLNCCSGFRYTINATNKDHRQVIKKLKDFAAYQTEIRDWGKRSSDDDEDSKVFYDQARTKI